jgi:hypothetical protein
LKEFPVPNLGQIKQEEKGARDWRGRQVDCMLASLENLALKKRADVYNHNEIFAADSLQEQRSPF